jgi:hypothetical protein
VEGSLITIVSQFEALDLTPEVIQSKPLIKQEDWTDRGVSLVKIGIQNITFDEEFTRILTESATQQAQYQNANLTLRKEMDTKLYEIECKLAIDKAEHEYKLSNTKYKSQRDMLRITQEREISKIVAQAEAEQLIIIQEAKDKASHYHYQVISSSGLSESYFVNELFAESWKHIHEQCKTMIIPSDYSSFLGRVSALNGISHDYKGSADGKLYTLAELPSSTHSEADLITSNVENSK